MIHSREVLGLNDTINRINANKNQLVFLETRSGEFFKK